MKKYIAGLASILRERPEVRRPLRCSMIFTALLAVMRVITATHAARIPQSVFDVCFSAELFCIALVLFRLRIMRGR